MKRVLPRRIKRDLGEHATIVHTKKLFGTTLVTTGLSEKLILDLVAFINILDQNLSVCCVQTISLLAFKNR